MFYLTQTFSQSSEETPNEIFSETISSQEIMSKINFLASDELEGRQTGERGQKVAARYIATQFEEMGLKPANEGSFYQNVPMKRSQLGETYIRFGGDTYEHFDQYIVVTRNNQDKEKDLELVLVPSADIASLKNTDAIRGKGVLLLAPNLLGIRDVAAALQGMGAEALLSVNASMPEQFEEIKEKYSGYFLRPSISLSEDPKLTYQDILKKKKEDLTGVIVSATLAKKLSGMSLADLSQKKDKVIELDTKIQIKAERKEEQIESENIISILEGTDKADEYVIVTSHYDHVGTQDGKVFNGADDNASGTSAVLEIAQAFTNASSNGYKPRRSMVFMTFTGEEMGLLGSEYYTKNPIFPLDKTTSNLNIDMVGRIDDNYKTDPNYIYLIGSDKISMDLHNISEEMNTKYTQLKLDYTYNDEADPNRFYYRSDHYNFAKNDIPIIFYFNGVHADYHQPTDTPDKILPEKIAHIAKLVFHTAWQVANRDSHLSKDGTQMQEEGNSGGE